MWLAADEVTKALEELIVNHHPDLIMISDQIAVVFRETAAKSGGEVVLGSTKTVAAMTNLLAGKDWKFIIELAGDEWVNLTDRQKEALLDHHLCACSADQDEITGFVKCRVQPADYHAYYDNVKRYGHWLYETRGEEEQSLVEELFGTPKKGATAAANAANAAAAVASTAAATAAEE